MKRASIDFGRAEPVDGPNLERSMRDLQTMARDWGYAVRTPSPTEGSAPRDDRRVVSGRLSSHDLTSGIKLCFHDLISLQDIERAAVPIGSIMVILGLGGSLGGYRYGSENVEAKHGGAVRITATDDRILARHYRRNERVRGLVLQINPAEVNDDHVAEHAQHIARLGGMSTIETSEHVKVLAEAVLGAKSEHDPLSHLLVQSCGLELLHDALIYPNKGSRPASSPDAGALKRVRDAILSDVGAAHSMDSLAKTAGISISSLKAKFPRAFGMPVFEFVRNERMRCAHHGLLHQGWSVKQAAAFVGYAHPGNFARAYRRHFGSTPKALRRWTKS